MTELTEAVILDSVHKNYRGLDRKALDNVSFVVARAESFGLLGPNGAGKTTTVKLVCGATAPTAGRLRVLGADPSGKDVYFKGGVGVVHQYPAFEMMLTVGDNLKVAGALKRLKAADVRRQSDELLSEFGIEDRKKQLVFTLSGGEQKRLAVVRALLGQPRLLVLDEPSAGLDIEGRRRVWSFVQDARLRRRLTVIWTSHDMAEIERNCERVAILHKGKLVTIASPEQLVQRIGREIAVFEVERPEDFSRLERIVEDSGFVGHRVGASFEVSGNGVRDHVPAVLARARAADITVNALRFRAPSLEDAFVELTRDRLQA